MRLVRFALLASLPAIGACAGTMLDEYLHQGFSTWRSSCQAAGLSFDSIISFTWQLLPNAIAGLLWSGLAVLAIGFFMRSRVDTAAACGAAHAGCALAMPVILVLCASRMPIALLAVVDVLLTVVCGLGVLRLITASSRRAHS